jgi:hypothetical protein
MPWKTLELWRMGGIELERTILIGTNELQKTKPWSRNQGFCGRYWTRIVSPQWGPTNFRKQNSRNGVGACGGRYWTRTNDLCDVNATL